MASWQCAEAGTGVCSVAPGGGLWISAPDTLRAESLSSDMAQVRTPLFATCNFKNAKGRDDWC